MPRNGSRVIDNRCEIEVSRGSSSGSGRERRICSSWPAIRSPMMIADSLTTKPIDIISNESHALTSTTTAASWANSR